MTMPNWPALILAPLMALANLTLAYALATPSCENQSLALLHGVAVASLVLTLLFSWMAWRNWRKTRMQALSAPEDAAMHRQGFVAGVATMAGLLSALVVCAQWIPLWLLSPCAV